MVTECVQGGHAPVDLASAVVGHDDAVQAQVQCPGGVVGVKDSFEEDGHAGEGT